MLPKRTMACSLPNKLRTRARTSSSIALTRPPQRSIVVFVRRLPSRYAASGDIALTVGTRESV